MDYDHCTTCHETFLENETIESAAGDECPRCGDRLCIIGGEDCIGCDGP